jgi:hypothetical protein
VVRLYGDVLCLLDIVDGLEDGQSVPDAVDSHGLEVFMV